MPQKSILREWLTCQVKIKVSVDMRYHLRIKGIFNINGLIYSKNLFPQSLCKVAFEKVSREVKIEPVRNDGRAIKQHTVHGFNLLYELIGIVIL